MSILGKRSKNLTIAKKKMRINLTDNNLGKDTFAREDIGTLFPLAGKSLYNLCCENEKLLIFPHDINEGNDHIGESSVFNIENTENPEVVRITTGNIVGFIGTGNLKIKIKSRFDNGRDDYFLHYMLQRVLSFNILDLSHNNEQEDIFDFIMFMFPYFLKKALHQGLYREYRREEHNDARIKGAIDVNRFIRKDIPFQGRIAYAVRNHSNDNAMTELIRHTIEYMKTKKYGQNILTTDSETVEYVRSIIDHTPNYCRAERQQIIQQNLRLRAHPYYTEYRPLQSLCLQILGMEEIKFGEAENEIYGIIFDAAWLWEEYLNIVLQPLQFKHPENKIGKGGFTLFEYFDDIGKKHHCGRRYPDFYTSKFVLDAKYKRFENFVRMSQIDRNDLHQLITYMTRLKVDKGGFIVPINKPLTLPSVKLKNTESTLSVYGLIINSTKTSYQKFKSEMAIEEELMKKQLIAEENVI